MTSTITSTAAAPSASNQSVMAGKIFDSMDGRGSGSLSKSDFMSLFLAMTGNSDTDPSAEGGTTYAIEPTRFAEVERPSFLVGTSYDAVQSLAERQAAMLFSSIDADGSGTITRDEFVNHFAPDPAATDSTSAASASSAPTDGSSGSASSDGTPTDASASSTSSTSSPSSTTSTSTVSSSGSSPVPTAPADPSSTTPASDSADATDPATQADQLMARYDTTGKGYFDEADLVAAWTANPDLGDPATAADVIAAWDDNGDGKVTKDEVLNGLSTMAYASQLLQQFDPSGNGYITLSDVTDQNSAGMTNAVETLTSWDQNGDGKVTEDELVNGIHALSLASQNAATAATTANDPEALFKSYDTNGDGVIDASELAGAASADQTDPQSLMAAWDTNGDGVISAQEFTDGYNAIKTASGIVARYDTAGKGWFDKADIQAAIDSNPAANAGADADAIMAAWDTNGDGKVTVPEVIAGLAAGGTDGSTSDTTVSSDMPSVADTLAAVGLSATPASPSA
jgi:Ca2+-binding EF-hand superfamily protein